MLFCGTFAITSARRALTHALAGTLAVALTGFVAACSPKPYEGPVLVLTADPMEVEPGGKVQLVAKGQYSPFTFEIVKGEGVLMPIGNEAILQAGMLPGRIKIRARDGVGQTSEVDVEVGAELPTLEPPSATINLGTGRSVQFRAPSGVTGPLQFLLEGPGMLDPVTGVYTPGSAPGKAIVRGVSSNGQVLASEVTVTRALVNGEVLSIARDPGYTYLGGAFSAAHPEPAPNLVGLDFGGQKDLGFDLQQGFDGPVRAILASPDGKALYVGGEFSKYRGKPAERIARILLPFGKLDEAFSAAGGFNGAVRALVTVGDHLFVGGNFTQQGGVNARGLARVSLIPGPSFGRAEAFPSTNGPVHALVAHAGMLYVGGAFSSPLLNLARVDLATASVDYSFTPDPHLSVSTANGMVNALAVNPAGTELVVGGDFQYVDVPAPETMVFTGLGRINLGTLAWSNFASSGMTGPTHAIVFAGGKAFVGGAFTSSRLLQLPETGGVATHLPIYDGQVQGLTATPDGHVYVAGQFGAFNGSPAQGLAKLRVSDNSQVPLPPGFGRATGNAEASAIAASSDRVFVGGAFDYHGGQYAGNLARFSVGSSAFDATFTQGAGFDGPVRAMLLDGSGLYAGGDFEYYNGNGQARFFARLDPSTGSFIASFNFIDLPNGPVHALAFGSGNALYLGGVFSGAFNVTANGLAAVSSRASTPYAQAGIGSTGLGGSSQVYALHWNGSRLFYGGWFNGGADYLRVSDLTTSIVVSSVNNKVYAFAEAGGSVFAAGRFVYAAGFGKATGLVKMDWAGGINTSDPFNQRPGLALGAAGSPLALASDGISIYLGGAGLQGINGFDMGGIAKIDAGNGSLDSVFTSSLPRDPAGIARVRAIDASWGQLAVGGAFVAPSQDEHFLMLDQTTGAPQ